MSYLTALANYRYPWHVRLVLALERRHYGQELEPARLWGRTARAFLAMVLRYGALDRRRSPIEPRLRSLAQVYVAQFSAWAFCIDINLAIGANRGVSQEFCRALALE